MKESKTLKKCQVHVLETKQDWTNNQLWLSEGYKPKYQRGISQADEWLNFKSYHLYITNNDRIHNRDWCVDTSAGMVFMMGDSAEVAEKYGQGVCKKIIATTDPQIHYSKIPTIPSDFITAYVREQGIKDVLLEYESVENFAPFVTKTNYITTYDLKVRSNNTVIIHPVKEKMYTRTELIEILKKFEDQASSYLYPHPVSWFNKNYPE